MSIIRNLVLLLSIVLCCLGCSNAPGRQELVKQVLPTLVNEWFKDMVEAKSISKTNGMQVDPETYIVYFKYEVVAKRKLTSSKNDDHIFEMMAMRSAFHSCGPIEAGHKGILNGSATFLRTENGWLMVDGDTGWGGGAAIEALIKCDVATERPLDDRM